MFRHLILVVVLQLSFNTTALLRYEADYGLQGDSKMSVFALDFNARRWHCMLQLLQYDWSAITSDLSSFLPFL